MIYRVTFCEISQLTNSRLLFGGRSAFLPIPHLHSKHAAVGTFAPESLLEPISPPATDARNRSSRGRLLFSPEGATRRRTSRRALRACSHARPSRSICVDSASR